MDDVDREAAEEAAALAPDADDNMPDSDDDDHDEREIVVDESWADLPPDELGEAEAAAAAAAAPGVEPSGDGGPRGSQGDDNDMLHDYEYAHEQALQAEVCEEASPEPAHAAVESASCSWKDAASSTLLLLKRIADVNAETQPTVGNLALCLQSVDTSYAADDAFDVGLGVGARFSERVVWLHLDAVGAGDWAGRFPDVCRKTGRIEYVMPLRKQELWDDFEHGRLRFLASNAGVGMFRGMGGVRNHLSSDFVEFWRFHTRLLVCATEGPNADLACVVCGSTMAETCALCGLNWHTSCAKCIAPSIPIWRMGSADLRRGAASLDFPPGASCCLCDQLLRSLLL